MKLLRLTPNCIPPESHGKNIRTMLPKDTWDLLRVDCYVKADYKCQICGGKGKKHPVEAHEEWDFDLKMRVQKLIAITALCPDCHLVKHIGRAELTGKFNKAFKHFCKVNKLKPLEGERALADFMNSRLELMGKNFKIDIDLALNRAQELLEEQLAVLKAFPMKGECDGEALQRRRYTGGGK